MDASPQELDHDSVGLWHVVFQSVATMGPGVGIALSILLTANFAGGAMPLAAVIGLVCCLFVAVSIGQLAKHLPSAGGPATFVARGVHPALGFMAGWGYSLAYLLATPFILLMIGFLVQSVLPAGATPDWWIPAALGAAALVFTINYVGIKTSTTAGLILGTIEIAVFIVLYVTLIGHAGSHNSLSVFGTAHANIKGFLGFAGVFAGSVYVILAFIGFDAAAPLGEEAKNPKRVVPRAVVGSCLLVGLFYVVGSYAGTVFFGANKMASFAAFNGGSPWTGMAKSVWGGGWWIVFIILINSALAVMNGAANAGTRVLYSMSRSGVLPPVLHRVHPRYRSPHIAVIFNFALGIALALGLGLDLGATNAFLWVATLVTALILPAWGLINLAVPFYYWRHRRSEFNPLLHLLIPALGVAALVLPFMANLGITATSFISPLTGANKTVPLVFIALYATGTALALFYWRKAPKRLEATGTVHVEETVPDDLAALAGPALVAQ